VRLAVQFSQRDAIDRHQRVTSWCDGLTHARRYIISPCTAFLAVVHDKLSKGCFPVINAVVISEERSSGRNQTDCHLFWNISSCLGVISHVVCQQPVILLCAALVQTPSSLSTPVSWTAGQLSHRICVGLQSAFVVYRRGRSIMVS